MTRDCFFFFDKDAQIDIERRRMARYVSPTVNTTRPAAFFLWMPKNQTETPRARTLALATGHKQNANGAYSSYSFVCLFESYKPLIALFFPRD